MLFSSDEMREILIAIAVMTIIAAYTPNAHSFVDLLPAAFVAVVVSFLLHEVAHKYMAHRYGVKAFFKLWPFGSIMGLILMFLPPLKLLAPGYVVIYSQRFGRWKRRYEKYSNFTEITFKQVGIIAVMGPMVNIILAVVGWYVAGASLAAGTFLNYFIMLNSWMAFVNLLPFQPLDGSKVFVWKPWLWFALMLLSAIFLFMTVPTFFKV